LNLFLVKLLIKSFVKNREMPVKIDSSYFGLSPHPCFDCDVLSELKEISDDLATDICLAPCEDIWKKFDDFLLTPPQSPPIKLDLVSDLVDFSSVESIGVNDNSSLHNADVLHDCMWSGQCVEDTTNSIHSHNNCTSNSIRICNRNHSRPDTPFAALSTSPSLTYNFDDLLSTCDTSSNDDIDDSQSSMDDEDFTSSQDSTLSSSSSTSFAKVKESLINDHSYGGSIVISKSQHKNSNKNYETQSKTI
jgi:hypothetical protein